MREKLIHHVASALILAGDTLVMAGTFVLRGDMEDAMRGDWLTMYGGRLGIGREFDDDFRSRVRAAKLRQDRCRQAALWRRCVRGADGRLTTQKDAVKA